MTPAELRALLAKATKGPWDQLDHDILGAERIADDREIAQFQLVDDANLVFAAVNALPALLDVFDAAALYRESVLAKREYSDWTEAMQRWKPAEFDRLVLRMNLKRSRGEALFAALAKLGSK